MTDKIKSNTEEVEDQETDKGTQNLLDKMRAIQGQTEDEIDDDEDYEDEFEDENTKKILEQMRLKIEQIHDEDDDN